jgi:hypothetical protein
LRLAFHIPSGSFFFGSLFPRGSGGAFAPANPITCSADWVRGFSCILGRRHAALQHILLALAQHLRIKKWRGEISSLDVQRQRAMLPLKKMFRDFAGFVPGPTGKARCLGRNT